MKIFKRYCNICNKETEDKSGICKDCLNAVSFHAKKRKCLKCGRIIPINSESICGVCQTENYNFDIAFSVYPYTKEFKEALLDFKFHGGFFRAKIFGALMTEALIKSRLHTDYLIPVPMRFSALRKRGYNQSLEIAYCMRKITKIPIISDGLIKIRNTAQQSALNTEERKENIKGAFSVNKFCANKIRGKEILLIDDVFTTGSTASECAKMLNEAGASGVNVITLLTAE